MTATTPMVPGRRSAKLACRLSRTFERSSGGGTCVTGLADAKRACKADPCRGT